MKEYVWAEGRLVGVMVYEYPEESGGVSCTISSRSLGKNPVGMLGLALLLFPGLGIVFFGKQKGVKIGLFN